MPSLKIIYAGTPDFAVPALQRLLEKHLEVVAVYTQPDRPKGRGQKLEKSPVKQLAEIHHISIEQPINFKDPKDLEILQSYQADIMVVAAYGLILPPVVLSSFPYGCINIHPSLLPHYRGALPVQQTILNGDKITGMTIIQMDEGMDSGPILWQKPYTLKGNETSAELLDTMAYQGADAIIEVLEAIEKAQPYQPIHQDHTKASYTKKLQKSAGRIDWNEPVEIIERKIRAFNPWPIAYADFHNETVRIWKATILSYDIKDTPGKILAFSPQGLDIATGQGCLRILEMQWPGKRKMSVAELFSGYAGKLLVGENF